VNASTGTSTGTGTAVADTSAATSIVQRPQRADARRNFDALLAAAREAFTQHGASASLEDIARRAGVGVGTLYRNFPTREALIEAVYVDEVVALQQAARDTEKLEPWDALRSWLHRYIEYVGTKRALIEVLNRHTEVMLACRAMLYGAGGPVVRRGQVAGVVRADTSIEDIVRLLSAVAGVAYEDEAQRTRILDLTIDALRAP
jgi:AcrR family transcriptional regulator